jgi:hypothetical protein
MRDYINSGLIGAAVFLTIAFGVFGAALSLLDGVLGRPRIGDAVPGTR